MFSLELVGHLKSLDYFLKMPDLQTILTQLHKLPVKVEKLTAVDRIRAENLLHYIKYVQK